MHPARDYYDTWAEFYDADFENHASDLYPDDTAFYRDLAVAADGPVLEVGCGTGRIYLDLLRAGVDAYGIDVSERMLDVLRERAAAAGLPPEVRQADMAEFDPEREYALVVVPYRAFLHNITLDDQRAALRNLKEALAPGGRLALNVFTPNFEFICEEYGEATTRTLAVDGEEYTVTTVTEIDEEVQQTVRERRTVERDGEVVDEATYRMALVSRREFELLFETTGWSDWTVYGGFEHDPLSDASQEMVWVAER